MLMVQCRVNPLMTQNVSRIVVVLFYLGRLFIAILAGGVLQRGWLEHLLVFLLVVVGWTLLLEFPVAVMAMM